MLAGKNRLNTTYEFNKVRRLGKKYTAKYFHLFYLKPRNYKGPVRVGIVVTNKFHKSAVKRNRVKRVFREIVRHNLAKMKEDFWVVIHPKFSTLEVSYEEINTDFVKNLPKMPLAV